jgi:hypothetical protein
VSPLLLPLLALPLAVPTLLVSIHRSIVQWLLRRADAGQTTAEYALVLLAAASVALLVIAWAARSGKVGQLLNAVMDTIISKVT